MLSSDCAYPGGQGECPFIRIRHYLIRPPLGVAERQDGNVLNVSEGSAYRVQVKGR